MIFICIKRINQICDNYDLDLEKLFNRLDGYNEGKIKEEEIIRSF